MCTVIAAALHFFYLSAFFIMLVEGVQLLLYIIYVFHVRRKRETALMLVLAWGTYSGEVYVREGAVLVLTWCTCVEVFTI